MNDHLEMLSYAFIAMTDPFFASGLAILTGERKEQGEYRLEYALSVLDYSLDTKRKRHIVGDVLLSISLLFGGLAITIITLKEEKYERRIE